jgi:hypothetical protein
LEASHSNYYTKAEVETLIQQALQAFKNEIKGYTITMLDHVDDYSKSLVLAIKYPQSETELTKIISLFNLSDWISFDELESYLSDVLGSASLYANDQLCQSGGAGTTTISDHMRRNVSDIDCLVYTWRVSDFSAISVIIHDIDTGIIHFKYVIEKVDIFWDCEINERSVVSESLKVALLSFA